MSWIGSIGRIAPAVLGAVVLGLGAVACSWVELSDDGRNVRVATTELLSECKPLGKTTVSTRDRVLLQRGEEKVNSELETLARNAAVNMGGNAVAPLDSAADGKRAYRVYRCGRDPRAPEPPSGLP